jgi:hypothetical protein
MSITSMDFGDGEFSRLTNGFPRVADDVIGIEMGTMPRLTFLLKSHPEWVQK